MGVRVTAILVVLACFAAPVLAQSPAPAEKLVLNAKSASTWSQGMTDIIQLEGHVTIELDKTKMAASQAVVWLTPVSELNLSIQDVHVALIGDAKTEQGEITRSGPRLFVAGQVRSGHIAIVAEDRAARDMSQSLLFQEAMALRNLQGPATRRAPVEATAPTQPSRGGPGSAGPTTRPAAQKAGPLFPVQFSYKNLESTETDEGTVAIVLTGGVTLLQERDHGDFISLEADRVVLFTPLRSLKELTQSERLKRVSQVVVGAYLEGDVRIDYTPGQARIGEQRMTADRVYYDFTTDRAVLTNAVLHTIEPTRQTPLIARAKIIRQLSIGEYNAEHAQLTTSSFAVPSLSVGLDKVYVRQEPSDNPEIGSRVMFQGTGVTLQAFDVPFLWLPTASGSLERGEALRSIGMGHSNDFGYEMMTEWGLFESLGMLPPRDLDANYRLDYFTDRGPGFGLNAAYGGGFLTDVSKQPWDFDGRLQSYFVYDHGADDVGRLPVKPPEEARGQVLWEHQHFFPDNWQVQARAGWASDPTFLEQWFRRDFEDGPPRDLMLYIKHQDQTEAFTLNTTYQPNLFVTNSEMQQEQFEVERLPELTYWRIGDGFANDNLTFFSENRAGGLKFQPSRATLREQGFLPPGLTPGIPAQGTTGLTSDIVWRGDFRQEVDMPFSVGPLRVVPYVFGRYTLYNELVEGPNRGRGFVGAGTHITTEIWKTDPTIQSDLLDIHQLRHVIEPEINLFSSATSLDNSRVFIYDTEVDKINDVSAVDVGLHQRWQTKRGGPGAWRSSDLFTFNVDAIWYANKPPRSMIQPYTFRGLFFESLPEASIPRDSLNSDASWRISDNTVLLGDMSWNMDAGNLQTMAVGLLVRRDTRLSYFIGNRYIGDAHSNITSFHADYELTNKYTVAFDQQFDFTVGHNVASSVSLVRRFDTFYLIGRYYVDDVTGENGFSFNIAPLGLGGGFDTGSFQTFRR